MSTKKDHLIVSAIALISAILAMPILANTKAAFWSFSFVNISAFFAGSLALFNVALWISGLIGVEYPGFFQFAKYGATGAMNALVDIGIFNLESMVFRVYSGPLVILFNVISFSISVTNAYFWSNHWVFKRDGAKPAFGEFLKFLGVTVSGLAVNTALVYILTTTIGSPAGISDQVWENIAKLIGIPISVLWNFFGYRIFVFK